MGCLGIFIRWIVMLGGIRVRVRWLCRWERVVFMSLL